MCDSKMYKIGDLYECNGKQGVVFEVTEDRKHGKIVSLIDSKELLLWSSDSAEQRTFIGTNSTYNGAENMDIATKIPNWRVKYPAFAWCETLGDGWYLPSIEELQTIFNNSILINPLLTDCLDGSYWSSTESEEVFEGVTCVWRLLMMDGSISSDDKVAGNYVRAVAIF